MEAQKFGQDYVSSNFQSQDLYQDWIQTISSLRWPTEIEANRNVTKMQYMDSYTISFRSVKILISAMQKLYIMN